MAKQDQTPKGNILIADDDPQVCRNLEGFFKNEGFGVYICHTVQALMELDHQNVKSILIDIAIDDNNGLQAVELIRQSPSGAQIPIIVCSDTSSTDSIIKGLNAGADDYILKPYSNRELLARVHALMRRSDFAC